MSKTTVESPNITIKMSLSLNSLNL